MARRATLPVGLLAVICSLIYSAPGGAQSPPAPKRCSVAADADDNAPHGKRISAAEVDAPHRKVIIERIQFDGPIHLADTDIAQVIAETNQHDLDADGSGWVEELAEIGLRGAWQDHGYFRVKVTAEAQSLGGDSSEEHFLVKAHIDEGLQYHLGDLRFANAWSGDVMSFSESELRNAFPLREGELFNVALIRKGIEELTKLYNSQGYIDFTAVPDTDVDDQLQRISLAMGLDQQKQFRIRTVDAVGLKPGLEAILKSKLKPGEIFNPEVIEDFFEENKSILPADTSRDNFQVRRDVRVGTVDLFFNFLAVGAVEGVVLDSTGQSVSDASVYYGVGDDSTIGESHETTTDCNGHFVLDHVLAGNIQIRAFKKSDGYIDRRFVHPFYGHTNDGEFPEIQVRAGEIAKGAVVRLGEQGALLRLNVLGADTRAPLDQVNYQMCRADQPGDNEYCLSTATSGQREVPQIVPGDTITLKIGANGYEGSNYRDEKTGSPFLTLHPGEVRSLTIYLKRNNSGNEH